MSHIDLAMEMQRIATHTSAEFVLNNMNSAVGLWSREQILDHVLSRVNRNGLLCEFGVAYGDSINYIAERIDDRTIHGFDCFTGLPERWRDGYEVGHFSCVLPEVRSNVSLYQGFFEDSIPEFLRSYDEDIAFIHIDCDLYSSTCDVLNLLGSHLVAGTVIVFDEFFNYPYWEHHEAKAWVECMEELNLGCEYLAYNIIGQQVALRVL